MLSTVEDSSVDMLESIITIIWDHRKVIQMGYKIQKNCLVQKLEVKDEKWKWKMKRKNWKKILFQALDAHCHNASLGAGLKKDKK